MLQHEQRDLRLAALMRAAQDGDRVAYARLLVEVTPLLRRMIRRRRGYLPVADLEDLVQDVLLSLHLARATYDPERRFLPWLGAIVRNRMADAARRHARRAANEIGSAAAPEGFSGMLANASEERYGDPEALRQAIHRLPHGQRAAVEMLKLGELSLKEAAAASGMSVAALKVSVHQAMKTLRVILKRSEA